MQSNKVEIKKREFLIGEPTIQGFQITCWQRKQEKYNIHMLSAVYETAEQLISNYESVRDYVAMFFQSDTLELDIERWNMYEFLFVKQEIGEEIKQKVEQDKFSTRKFVFDGIIEDITEEFIKEVIIDELFTFDVQKRTIGKVNVKTHLRHGHSEVMTFLDKYKSEDNDNTELTKLLIKNLGYGEN